MKGLSWLKNHQLPDGSWTGEGAARSKTALTGLALLAFLWNGETPASERYGETVGRAIRFLAEQDWQGDRFLHADVGGYGHGIAACALSEAYAMTRIPAIKPVAEAAVARIVRGQQPAGGFNYGLVPSDTRSDVSLAGWMARAMAAAHLAGLDVPGLEPAMERAAQSCRLHFDARSGMFAYAGDSLHPDLKRSGSLSVTGSVVCALQALGRDDTREARTGARMLGRRAGADFNRPQGLGAHPLYARYFAARALRRAGASDWAKWSATFVPSYVRAQNADGSWPAPEGGAERGYGPVYATAFCTLSLSLYTERVRPSFEGLRLMYDGGAARSEDVGIEVQ